MSLVAFPHCLLYISGQACSLFSRRIYPSFTIAVSSSFVAGVNVVYSLGLKEIKDTITVCFLVSGKQALLGSSLTIQFHLLSDTEGEFTSHDKSSIHNVLGHISPSYLDTCRNYATSPKQNYFLAHDSPRLTDSYVPVVISVH